MDSALYSGAMTLSTSAVLRAIGYSSDFGETASAGPLTIHVLPQYELDVSIVGEGTVMLEPLGDVFVSNSVVKLVATPSLGWRFTGWSGDFVGTEAEVAVRMDSAKEIIADFQPRPRYKLTTEVVGEGTIVVEPESSDYIESTLVALSASEVPGWRRAMASSW